MAQAAIAFEGVWKKFRRGERHDSLRDLVPAVLKRAFRGPAPVDLAKDEFWVLKDVSFEVHAGEAVGIIGPNGAGKSTTLKLLTRILRPTRGMCDVRGRIGALIELAAGFHPDLTGRENIYLQGAIMGMKPPEIRQQFDAIVEFSALSEFIDTPVKRYSSGMNARLGFSIAAHLNPDVLIIDEVLAVGDFTFQQKCHERLTQFRDAGMPILLVSHNMQAVASLCRRAILLRSGQPAVVGPSQEITAQFLSSVPRQNDPRAALHSSALALASGGGVPRTISPGTPLTLDLDFEANQALPRCGVVFKVFRSDGHEVFNGGSNIDTPTGVDLAEGDRLQARIVFHPHVLRGLYVIHAVMQDTHRLWAPLTFANVASFTVSETTRSAGSTELYPHYELRVKPRA